MTKPLDPALKSLRAMDRALQTCPERMRRANLEYLWDKYVTNPPPVRFLSRAPGPHKFAAHYRLDQPGVVDEAYGCDLCGKPRDKHD